MANSPLQKFKFGRISLTVWENVGKDFTTVSYQLAKNYQDKDNNWKTTNSYKATELINVIQACQAALDYHYRKDEVPAVEKPTPTERLPI